MKDITRTIKECAVKDVLWSVNDFPYALQLLVKDGLTISYWENEECWATVSLDNQIIGYVWKKYPLIMTPVNFQQRISKILTELNYINYIAVNSLVEKELTLEYDEVNDIVDFFEEYKAFSSNDFWFYTNSI